MDFGIMFFSSADGQTPVGKYHLLLEAARLADARGFTCVWTPERHFHSFGGLFPNPSVTSAALAVITSRVQLRAGSLISPLHDVVRIVEEWSVVDNLSGGRVAVSFGSGWNVNDFVFFPERYASRHAVMYRQIEAVRDLWAGREIEVPNSEGKLVRLRTYPRPVQESLPVWVTSSGNAETFASAGAVGANVLTHLIGQDIDTLAEKIRRYRDARGAGGHDPQAGRVSLMLHTFMGPDEGAVKAKVRGPFRDYIKSAVSLETIAAQAGGVISGGHKIEPHHIPPDVLEELLDITFERYFRTAALMGSAENCREFVGRLQDIGVDEIACLIDFIEDSDAVLGSLEYVAGFKESFSADAAADARRVAVDAFIEEIED
ncbi:MAG: MupA/Atu3671 family FMN-dependent luciferase-like monooxygenase [Pyrinomonadaceae bacterium]